MRTVWGMIGPTGLALSVTGRAVAPGAPAGTLSLDR